MYARLASVLHELHTAGFVHRDVKPTNVRVEDDDDGAAVEIIDLELAVKREELASLAGERIAGTPLYMSPEMIKGEQVTAASVVVALGVMLAEAMTGRWPRNLFTGAGKFASYPHIRIGDVRIGVKWKS